MEMISGGTGAFAQLAFNWTSQSQSAAMPFMLFTTKLSDEFTVANDSQRLANRQHMSVCIALLRRPEDRMEHRRYEFVQHINDPRHRHDQWTDNASE